MFSKDTAHLWVMAMGLALVGVFYVIVRTVVVPPSFGEFGHYRGDSLRENAAIPRNLVSASECLDCHVAQAEKFKASPHHEVHCGQCHGDLLKHFDDCTRAAKAAGKAPDKSVGAVKCDVSGLKLETIRVACVRCHVQLVGRPEKFPTINPGEHLADNDAENRESPKVCLQCHSGHDPTEQPEEGGDAADEAPAAEPPATATPAAAPAAKADDEGEGE